MEAVGNHRIRLQELRLKKEEDDESIKLEISQLRELFTKQVEDAISDIEHFDELRSNSEIEEFDSAERNILFLANATERYRRFGNMFME